MDLPKISEHALPGVLQTIAGIAGIDCAVRIARDLGGRRFYVPRDLAPGHSLSALVGEDAARAISKELGGERLDIPSARPFLRWYDARRLRQQGMSHAEISRALGITQSHVANLLRGFNAPAAHEEAAE